jgi:hypothetical protein
MQSIGARTAAVIFWVGAVLLLLSVVGILHTYGVVGLANGGITVSVPGFNGGLELWGAPGFFDCRDLAAKQPTLPFCWGPSCSLQAGWPSFCPSSG